MNSHKTITLIKSHITHAAHVSKIYKYIYNNIQRHRNQYIVINPGTKKQESQTPGALYVALSRAKTAGTETEDPGFAFHSHVLLNDDRVCHVVNTVTTRGRNAEVKRLHNLAVVTREKENCRAWPRPVERQGRRGVLA